MSEEEKKENVVAEAPVESQTIQNEAETPTVANNNINDEIAALKAKNAELQHEYAVRSGRYGDELEKLKSSLASMQEMNSKLLDKLSAQANKGSDQLDNIEQPITLPSDVAENIGGDTSKSLSKWVMDNINRVTEKRVAEAIKKAKQDLVENEIKHVASRSQQSEAAINNELFLSSVEKLAPGFRSVNGNQFTNEPSDPKWDAFLKTNVPDLDISWMQLFNNSGNDPKVAASAYKRFSSEQQAKKPVVQSAENQVAPTTVKAAARAPSGKNTLKREAFEKFKQEIYTNPTKYTSEKRDEIMNEFCQAAVEGRLV